MKASTISTMLLAAAVSSACTTELKATRVVGTVDVPLAGAPYNLPYTRFKVSTTRRVVACEPGIKVKVQVTAEPEQRRDPLRSYVIDLESLQSFFKSSSIQVSYYDSGAIKSINGSAEDKTGEFIVSTAQTVAKLVASAAGIGSKAAIPGTPPPALEQCAPELVQAVKDLPGEELALKNGIREVELKTEELKQLVALAVVMGRTLPQAKRQEIGERMKELFKLQAISRAIEERIKNNLALTSVEDETHWPDNGETFVSASAVVDPVDAETIEKWLGKGHTSANFQAGTAVYLELKATEVIGRKVPCDLTCKDDEKSGLKYRIPAEGTLSMCSALTRATPADPAHCDAGKVVAKAGMISQLGNVYTLPLKSAVFTTKSVTATFTETGVPTLVGTTSGAASDKAAATFGGLADSAIAIRSTRAGREAADLENQIKVLKLKKELDVASAALVPAAKDPKLEATSTFTVDTALLAAELANIEAKRALDEAKQTGAAP